MEAAMMLCGICGELRFDGSPVQTLAVDRMSDRIAPGGPGHTGAFSDGPLALGDRRLAVIDLTADADQPMVDEALELVMVFNGTICNYKKLRAERLGIGYRFFSDGDSEVILKAYHAWGARCGRRFFGIFAFAVWDQRDASLFMARNRFGIKPLYYAPNGSRLRFASARRGVGRMLVSSGAEQIVRTATVPVLWVRGTPSLGGDQPPSPSSAPTRPDPA